MKNPLAVGQWLQHERFGLGVTVRSDAEHTLIDFDAHGPKLFVTRLLEAPLSAAPDRPAPKRRKAAAKVAAKVAP